MARRLTRTVLPPIPRDNDILQHVWLHRITTPEILHDLYFKGESQNAVTKVTSRLCDREYLRKCDLYSSYKYFMLGRSGARMFDIPYKKISKPLRPKPLYDAYGKLLFFHSQTFERRRKPLSSLVKTNPEYIAKGIDSTDYGLEKEGDIVRLGYVWVEAGGDAKYIRKKVEDEIIEPRRQQVDPLRHCIDQGGFFVGIVTTSEHRRANILAELNSIPLSSTSKPVTFRVESYPALFPLLPK